jgi:TonB family protein
VLLLSGCGAAAVDRVETAGTNNQSSALTADECDDGCQVAGDEEATDDDANVEVASDSGVQVVPILQHSQVQSVILGNYSSISGCHTIEYSGKVARSGRMTLAWVIEPDGSVSGARVVESSLRSNDFEACVLAVFQGLRFPPSREGMEVGSWQIAFRDQ